LSWSGFGLGLGFGFGFAAEVKLLVWDAECCEEDTRVVSWVTAQLWRRKLKVRNQYNVDDGDQKTSSAVAIELFWFCEFFA
jgi:hypothetical protein